MWRPWRGCSEQSFSGLLGYMKMSDMRGPPSFTIPFTHLALCQRMDEEFPRRRSSIGWPCFGTSWRWRGTGYHYYIIIIMGCQRWKCESSHCWWRIPTARNKLVDPIDSKMFSTTICNPVVGPYSWTSCQNEVDGISAMAPGSIMAVPQLLEG